MKCWPSVFEGLLSGEKTFEIRLNDRGYQVGDVLYQREWSASYGYTGREVRHRVAYVLAGGAFGLAQGHVAMSLAPLAPPSAPPATDANGVWIPPNLYKAACALDALIHSTPDMSGDLRDVRLTGGPKKISDAVRAFKWSLSAPPSPEGASNDRLLLLKALLMGKATIGTGYLEDAGKKFINVGYGEGVAVEIQYDAEGQIIITDSLRAALTEATHG